MPSHKMQRNTEDIKRELTAILRELKDPRVNGGLISIVRVEVTNDMAYCTVYVSSMEGLERAKVAVKGLESAAGYIRREVGNRLHLRHVPQMIFKPSDLIEYSAHISHVMSTISEELREKEALEAARLAEEEESGAGDGTDAQ